MAGDHVFIPLRSIPGLSTALAAATGINRRGVEIHLIMTNRIHAGWWSVPLRLVIGYGFIAHGMAKLMRGPDAFAGILAALAVPWPHASAWSTILIEIAGGAAMFAGAFVPLAAVPLSIVLLVAMFTVHLPYGFSSIKLVAVTANGAQFGPPGYEVNLLYIAALAALTIGGAGPVSIDRWRAGNRRTQSDR